MISTRETVYQALFDLLSSTPGFVSYFRKIVPVANISSGQQPALMMRQVTEQRQVKQFGAPPKYILTVEIILLIQSPTVAIDSTPAASINPLIDAVETQLTADPPLLSIDGKTLLGKDGILNLGLDNVERVWIEGLIEIFEAVEGSNDQSVVVIPVHISCV